MTNIVHRVAGWFFSGNSGMEDVGSIKVYKNTNHPTKAWSEISVKQTVNKVVPLSPDTPISVDKLRVVCISDTHTKIEAVPKIVPDGDILIHAGDFTNVGLANEVKKFNAFLGSLSHQVKIVIAGNHDLTFDDEMVNNRRDYLRRNFGVSEKGFEQLLETYNVQHVKELLTNCVYLEDAGIDVCGVHIYGSPWQPEFCDWGFNLPRGEKCLEKWNLIPSSTDILITHGPPIGHGDACFDKNRAGCVELLSTIQQRVKPKYHIFGHIHEGYGVTSDGHTTYINASTCTLRYRPDHAPVVFDYPVPEGHMKDELLKISPQRLIRSAFH
ncbi:metallophosphoesterase MPPED2-like [Mercenaria mercenaria]|uniref:metallophosphoesterase MPPED2-like n=1 Tax=Mercenaria mercenaria TaxID=6596 RepID=UPI00234FA88F|nr:metallophosphoesterase MPPED2-like [Mercenaria mercenaria]